MEWFTEESFKEYTAIELILFKQLESKINDEGYRVAIRSLLSEHIDLAYRRIKWIVEAKVSDSYAQEYITNEIFEAHKFYSDHAKNRKYVSLAEIEESVDIYKTLYFTC